MSQDDLKTFRELLEEFDTAMLVTRHGAELRSRPMAIADTTTDGRVRFITRDDSGKLSELEEDDNVNVAMQGDATFLSISGHARLTKEEMIIDESWQRKQSPWFAEGRDDPHLIVIEIIPTYAEYWDRSGVGIVQLAIERARDALSDDDRLRSGDLGRHGSVDFHGRPL